MCEIQFINNKEKMDESKKLKLPRPIMYYHKKSV